MQELLLGLSLIALTCLKRFEFAQIAQEVTDSNLSWTPRLDPTFDYDDEDVIRQMGSGSRDDPALLEAELGRLAGRTGPRLLQTPTSIIGPFVRTISSGPLAVLSADQYPQNLDLRLKYPRCRAIKVIRNQSLCAGCWAVAIANAISDRFCIQKTTPAQTFERMFSIQDLLECCPTCYFDQKDPCAGGFPYQAYLFAKSNGLVSGDAFVLNNLCKPYFLPENFNATLPSLSCQQECNPLARTPSYFDDKMKIQDFAYGKGMNDMIAMLNTFGSITATMRVYKDLYVYETGVYRYAYGSEVGGHAVRVIGYGVDAGVPFWLIANSWGASWGERGFFRMLRGTDECGIESGYVFTPIL